MTTDDSDNALLLESLAWDIPKDLNELSTTRLCLVQWHPLATEEAKMAAELIYWRRRNRAQAAATVARIAAEQEQSNTEEKVKEESSSKAPVESSRSSVTATSGAAAEAQQPTASDNKKEASEPINTPAVISAAPPANPVAPAEVPGPQVVAPAQPDITDGPIPALTEPIPALAEAPAGEDAAARDIRFAAYQAMLRRQIEHDRQRRQIEADRRLAEQMARSQKMRQQHNVQVARRARQERPSSSSSSDSTPIQLVRNRPEAPPAAGGGDAARERTAREAAEHHARLRREGRMPAAARAERLAQAERDGPWFSGPNAPQRPANIAPIMVPRPGAAGTSGTAGRAQAEPPISPERRRVLNEARTRMRALEQPRHLPDAAARRRRFEVLCNSLGNPQTPADFLEALTRAHTALQAQRSTGIPDYNYWKNKADYITLLAQERERRNRAFQAGLDALEQERLRRFDDRADLASIADSAEDLEGEVLRRRRSMAPTPSSVLDGPQHPIKEERDAPDTGMQIDAKKEEEGEAKPSRRVRANSLAAASEADRQARSNAPTPAGGVRFRDQESVIPTPRYGSPEDKPVVKPEPKSEEKPNIRDERGNRPGQGTSSAPSSPSTSKRKREEEDTLNGTEPGTPPPRYEGNDQKKAKIEEDSPAIVKREPGRPAAAESSDTSQGTPAGNTAQPSSSASATTSTSVPSPASNAINRPGSRSGTPSSVASEDTSRAKVPAEYVSDFICLYVGNIPSSISANELRTWLLESMPDLPRPAAVCRASRSVGAESYYARVYYATQADAERVLITLRKRTIGIQGAKPSLAIVKQKMSKLSILWSDLEAWARDRVHQKMGTAPVASTSTPEQSIRGIARVNGVARPASSSSSTITSTPPASVSESSAAPSSSNTTATRSPPVTASLGSRALDAMTTPQDGLPLAESSTPSTTRRRGSFSALPNTLEARLDQPEASHATPVAAGRPASLQERLGALRNATPNGQTPSAGSPSQNRHSQTSVPASASTAPRAARQDQANGQHVIQLSSSSAGTRVDSARQGSLLSRLGQSASNTAPSAQQTGDTSRNTPKPRSNSSDLLSRLG